MTEVYPTVIAETAADADWPLPQHEMIAVRVSLKRLIQLEPDSAFNAERQRVLDNWPRVRPVI